MNERHSRGLAELADLGLALARDLQARALAAPEMAEASDLALAFQRVSRSVRQTWALEAKLERDARRGVIEDEERAAKARKAGTAARADHVRTAVSRLIWTEAEGDELQALDLELEEVIAVEALAEAFVTDPVEAVIARICAALGLPVPAGGGEGASDEGPSAQGPPPEPATDIWT